MKDSIESQLQHKIFVREEKAGTPVFSLALVLFVMGGWLLAKAKRGRIFGHVRLWLGYETFVVIFTTTLQGG